MKKRKVKERELEGKMVAGGEAIAYDAITHKRISLKTGKEVEPNNIVKFPEKPNPATEFQIPYEIKTRDDFERLVFVSKAISKDKKETRPFKKLIHVEMVDDKKMAIATDGTRLHAAQIYLDLIPGDYTITIVKKRITLRCPIESGDTYPNWKRVIPENKSEKTVVDFTGIRLSRDRTILERMSQRMYKLIKKTGKLINLYFLNDLTDHAWVVYTGDDTKNSPIVFSKQLEKEIFALIMPLELENSDDE
jgi:hypothetical protein